MALTRMLWAWVLVSSFAGGARAQEEARAIDCGEELARRGDYEAAVEPMTRCFELAPRMSLAFNLAIVLRNAGQARRALALLDELARGAYGEVPEARREALAAQREATLASVATLVVSLPAPGASAEISVDGIETHAVGATETSATFHVDPGEHAITAQGEVCAAREVLSVSRGDRREVVLRVTPCAPVGEDVPLAASRAAGETDRGGGDDAVLLGVGIGIGVAVVAGAVALGIVLGSGTDAPSCTGGRACIETLVATEPLLRF